MIALALALAVVLLTGTILNCQHNWGDDFAAYLLEGTALSEGRFDEQVSLNYALHHRLDPKANYGQEHVYVWGYPLLLAAVCSAVGYDRTDFSSIVFYKLPNLLFLGVFVFAGVGGESVGLEVNVEDYYNDTNLADGWIYSANIDDAFLDKVDSFGVENKYSQAEIDKEIDKWNWGAFFCSWIWAVYHKIYWPLAILIIGVSP